MVKMRGFERKSFMLKKLTYILVSEMVRYRDGLQKEDLFARLNDVLRCHIRLNVLMFKFGRFLETM